MPKNHISNPYIGIIEMFESENRKSSTQNRKIEIGIIEAEIRIEATQLTRRIVTALVSISTISYQISRSIEGTTIEITKFMPLIL